MDERLTPDTEGPWQGHVHLESRASRIHTQHPAPSLASFLLLVAGCSADVGPE